MVWYSIRWFFGQPQTLSVSMTVSLSLRLRSSRRKACAPRSARRSCSIVPFSFDVGSLTGFIFGVYFGFYLQAHLGQPGTAELSPVKRHEWDRYAPNVRFNADSVPFNLEGGARKAFVQQDINTYNYIYIALCLYTKIYKYI